MPTVQYSRVARDGVSTFTGDRWTIEIRERGLTIQTPRLSVGTGLGPDQQRRSINLCIDSVHLNLINTEDSILQHCLFNSLLLHLTCI